MVKKYLVIYDNKKVIESFSHAWAAKQFVAHCKKDYFGKLDVIRKDIWEEKWHKKTL
jgi:hypothetical protein